MKSKGKWKNGQKESGFTLIEMVIVLFIISVIMLLVIPNLTNQKKNVDLQGSEALATVVQTQIELYDMEKDTKVPKTDISAAVNTLETAGYLTESQKKQAISKLTIENGEIKAKAAK
ncbi:competence type IV pilus major pilin ComGC [Pisciglobus halotolerans]|uniref:Competence protein ComGC n=1 Tax=Pisciglobus halotolerans TaxID=745365 RepID=A0A1I3CW36_9LACT|nr:competence type IV pilus major pilin ComGC [Pisciglobus halotolerans]SFH78616.1 competence protein ComGC [Pisciglobus halotolerans]